MHTFNPSSQKPEIEGLRVQGSPGLPRDPPSTNKPDQLRLSWRKAFVVAQQEEMPTAKPGCLTSIPGVPCGGRESTFIQQHSAVHFCSLRTQKIMKKSTLKYTQCPVSKNQKPRTNKQRNKNHTVTDTEQYCDPLSGLSSISSGG